MNIETIVKPFTAELIGKTIGSSELRKANRNKILEEVCPLSRAFTELLLLVSNQAGVAAFNGLLDFLSLCLAAGAQWDLIAFLDSFDECCVRLGDVAVSIPLKDLSEQRSVREEIRKASPALLSFWEEIESRHPRYAVAAVSSLELFVRVENEVISVHN